MASDEQQEQNQQLTQQEYQEQMNKLMKNGTDLQCNNCGCLVFNSGKRIRFFQQDESPTGQEGIHPLDEYTCLNCGEILDIETEIQKIKVDPQSYSANKP